MHTTHGIEVSAGEKNNAPVPSLPRAGDTKKTNWECQSTAVGSLPRATVICEAWSFEQCCFNHLHPEATPVGFSPGFRPVSSSSQCMFGWLRALTPLWKSSEWKKEGGKELFLIVYFNILFLMQVFSRDNAQRCSLCFTVSLWIRRPSFGPEVAFPRCAQGFWINLMDKERFLARSKRLKLIPLVKHGSFRGRKDRFKEEYNTSLYNSWMFPASNSSL